MLKKLLHSVREYKLATILSPFLMIGEVAMEVTIPTVMEKLVDNLSLIHISEPTRP